LGGPLGAMTTREWGTGKRRGNKLKGGGLQGNDRAVSGRRELEFEGRVSPKTMAAKKEKSWESLRKKQKKLLGYRYQNPI